MPRNRYGNISKVLMRQKAAAEPFNIPSLCGLDVVLRFETSDKIACYVVEGEVSLEGERICNGLPFGHALWTQEPLYDFRAARAAGAIDMQEIIMINRFHDARRL
ncbi:hypothetical protein I7I51_06707 [Histoplasma capsulatum]|uniref:Uncharacterized protein n=1 Tax=Ajellomyces capsulatus TaxID=5037 RepID=A0A8A1MHA6_AJECA|nr:hypothetical protein I7I51_06707 [Histoplasma capsulatum]